MIKMFDSLDGVSDCECFKENIYTPLILHLQSVLTHLSLGKTSQMRRGIERVLR
jgi:hypothetical protein